MATDLEFGSVREVWFATLADPNTKYSFLIRDDAFSKSGAIFGRTVRLGDPLNTGPGSGWRQLTWEGGNGQRAWKDEAMFQEGTADVWSHEARIRMWPGWAHVHKDPTRKFDSFALAPGNAATTAFGTTLLYAGERNIFYTGGAPSGGFKAYKYDPSTNTWTTLPTTPTTLGSRGYTAIVGATDDASSAVFAYFGTSTGLWVYSEPGNTWSQDTGAPATGVEYDSMVCFRDAMFFLSGQSLYKRTPLPPYGVIGTHTKLKQHQSAYVTRGLCVWNNRLWYGIQFAGNRVGIGTSDGVTAQQVVEMPEEFVILKMQAHYGALYIFGSKPQAVAGTKALPAGVAQVWKYTGSSLTKLWESNDEDKRALTDGKSHIAGGACSFGPLLVWSNPGFANTPSPRGGLMCYDAEKDAFLEGPSFPIDLQGIKDGFNVNVLAAWNNTIVVGYHDFHNYVNNGAAGVDWCNGISYIRWPNLFRNKHLRLPTTFKGRSIEVPEPVRTQFVLSSRYVGEPSVAAETKTWLSGKVICKIPSQTSLKIYIVTNEYESYLVKTVEYSASATGWRTVTFPLKNPGQYYTFPVDDVQGLSLDVANNGKYLQSATVQYRLELSNTQESAGSTATPEVDSIEIGWMVAPTKRRQWHMRFVMEDGQARLTDVANPMTLAQTMADRLETLWSQSLPFRMWGPYASSIDPTTLVEANATEVLPSVESYTNQQYRVETGDAAVAQETGLTLIENITS